MVRCPKMREPHNRTIAAQRPLNGIGSKECVVCGMSRTTQLPRGMGGIVRLEGRGTYGRGQTATADSPHDGKDAIGAASTDTATPAQSSVLSRLSTRPGPGDTGPEPGTSGGSDPYPW